MENEQAQLSLFDNLGKYLLLYGIFIIAAFLLGILVFIFSFAAFMAILEFGM